MKKLLIIFFSVFALVCMTGAHAASISDYKNCEIGVKQEMFRRGISGPKLSESYQAQLDSYMNTPLAAVPRLRKWTTGSCANKTLSCDAGTKPNECETCTMLMLKEDEERRLVKKETADRIEKECSNKAGAPATAKAATTPAAAAPATPKENNPPKLEKIEPKVQTLAAPTVALPDKLQINAGTTAAQNTTNKAKNKDEEKFLKEYDKEVQKAKKEFIAATDKLISSGKKK
ncbi:MAG: hypothetical protein LBJ73_03055 [Rickettsiales bacterium]|jgi:hypothetical protein|nr:hypothetical protein [Rickettsiales bacterium]